MSSRAGSSISSYRPIAATFTVLLATLLAVLLAAITLSCGYSVRKAPIAAVALGNVKNATFEPGLEDRLLGAISRELMRAGVRVDPAANWRIEGEITHLSIQGTAESEGVTVQYDVTIRGAFRLVGPEDAMIPLDAGSEFLVSFGGEGPLEELLAGKERSLGSALDSMASNIVSSLIEKAPPMERQ